MTTKNLFSSPPPAKGASPLSQSPMFAGLAPPQLARLEAMAVPVKAGKDEIIFLQGQPAKGFYVITGGRVKVFMSSPDGREAVLHLYGPGETVGEVAMFRGMDFPANAMAVADSTLMFLPRDGLVSLLKQDPDLAMNMLASLGAKLREFTQRIEALTLRELPQRLAAYLLDLAEREDAVEIRLDLTRGLLASFLGATRETLSRALSRLADQGVIEVKGRIIRLLDREALEDMASGEIRG